MHRIFVIIPVKENMIMSENGKEFNIMITTAENKLHARKTFCAQGHLHDSKLEALRCNELNLLAAAGRIKDLRIQEAYLLIPPMKYGGPTENERKCEYIADFVYFDNDLEKTVIEDSKGHRTPEYIIKRKLVKQLYCNEDTVFIESGRAGKKKTGRRKK